MTDSDHPEIGSYVDAGGIKTNYLEAGDGAAGRARARIGTRGHGLR